MGKGRQPQLDCQRLHSPFPQGWSQSPASAPSYLCTQACAARATWRPTRIAHQDAATAMGRRILSFLMGLAAIRPQPRTQHLLFLLQPPMERPPWVLTHRGPAALSMSLELGQRPAAVRLRSAPARSGSPSGNSSDLSGRGAGRPRRYLTGSGLGTAVQCCCHEVSLFQLLRQGRLPMGSVSAFGSAIKSAGCPGPPWTPPVPLGQGDQTLWGIQSSGRPSPQTLLSPPPPASEARHPFTLL